MANAELRRLREKKSSDTKSRFLGMSHGTACNRLRKMILFNLLKKHGENTCCKCGYEITDASMLSIEHIKPWQGRDVGLFWDLGNIAFSHANICNKAHAQGHAARSLNYDVSAQPIPKSLQLCFL